MIVIVRRLRPLAGQTTAQVTGGQCLTFRGELTFVRRETVMDAELMQALEAVLVICFACVILLPVFCWILPHREVQS